MDILSVKYLILKFLKYFQNNTTDDLWSQVNLKKEKIQETQNKINSIQKKQTLTKRFIIIFFNKIIKI